MKIVNVTIEKTKDHYSAFTDNLEGIYGGGDTPEEAIKSIVESIKLFKKHNKLSNIPAILKGEYKIVYKFDTESLLNYYQKVFTKSALEHLTGINQRQLQHYSSGLKKPRPAQKKKIEEALHQLGSELLAVHL
ncbi:type II toxin-antitoxin system HicB family antitoxin [Longitalea arenae]|uniref:type II toxin-antitoxin system HicB family antitoxin n=1 Tax=Longitalea arenae TaxID=2812558 RepID=UPI001968A418|nr:type II toxin-antitoxin system HicB family antitoxin [Longitalea arenae]